MSIINLIKELQENPLFKDIVISKANVRQASYYASEKTKCQKCVGIKSCASKNLGMEPFFIDNQVVFNECKYQIEAKKQLLMNLDFASNYISEANFKDFNLTTNEKTKCFNYVNSFLKNKKEKGLYIYGPYGTGKTYFLSALAKELSNNNISSVIAFMPDFSRKIKEFMNDNVLEAKINLLKNVDVLMLDDLGGEMMTSWLRDEIIAPIIQHRMVNNLPIFITSNLDYPGLRNHFSQTRDDLDEIKSNRILERIMKMTKRVCFQE